MATQAQKYIGCLLGESVGDAAGAPLLGLDRAAIAALGDRRDFAPALEARTVFVPVAELGDPEFGDPLEPGQWTDCTQLTLALAETLAEEGRLLVPEAWAYKLVRLLNDGLRCPGSSTLYAAMQLRAGGIAWEDAADPDGAGCGPATRTAPIALLYPDDPQQRRRNAVLQAQVTHGHPDAHAAALAVTEAIALALPIDPASLPEWSGEAFLRTLVETVRAASPNYAEFARCLELAHTLLLDNVDTATAMRVLGNSAWSREAVPCALYGVARSPAPFATLLETVLNFSGGAVNAIAAIAGAVGGALHGVADMPERWLEGVEDSARLIYAARALLPPNTEENC